MHFLPLLFISKIFIVKIRKCLFLILLSKMLSSSIYALLKLSKTKSPHKKLPSDCITLYLSASSVCTRWVSPLYPVLSSRMWWSRLLWPEIYYFISMQGDQLCMVVFLWYLVYSTLSSVYTTVHVYTGQVTFFKVAEKPGHV